jgi:pyridoxamine 5'-phosphate oxidase
MNKAEIIDFMNETHTCYMATLEGNKPHVRAIGIFKADEDGIIIQTWTFKDIYKQLSANPNVELCFHDAKRGVQVRVSGAVELLDDLELKKEIVAERTFMKPIVEERGYEVIAIYRLKKGVAHAWTMKTNLAPKTYIQL